MRHIGLLLAVLILFSPDKPDKVLKLGIVNGRASIKTEGSTQWMPISSDDMDMTVHLKDSVRVLGTSLYIREKVGNRTKGYQADTGNWTVEDIVKGKAYHTNRKKEDAGEAVKGDYQKCYFDLLVGGKATEEFHFGDHPELRVINDSDHPVFFSVFWMEGDAWWSMLDSRASVCLDAKCSTLETLRDAFVIGPPEGDAAVYLALSDEPFVVLEALRSIALGENTFKTLIKRVVVCE